MRSLTTSHRRLHAPAAPDRLLDTVADLVDRADLDGLDGLDGAHQIVRVVDDGDHLTVGTRALPPGTHPFTELAGWTAPASWAIFGLRVRGQGRHLTLDGPPEATTATYVIDRRGAERSILRTGARSTRLPGPAMGTLPDLCRRVLGLPTAPAPATSASFWTTRWMDALLESWHAPGGRDELRSWLALARRHPAAGTSDTGDLAEPTRLVQVATAHAERWTWARLRAEPTVLCLPDGELPPTVSEWMDDGFLARWSLGAFPEPATLLQDLLSLLPDDLRRPLLETVVALLEPDPA